VVNGNDDLKLTDIRRPAFFGQAPYFEDIAKLEKDTYTVEFTVPRGPYEQLQLKMTDPVKLRGWFIKGKGVPDTQGKKLHALVIYIDGCSYQMCTIQHPYAPLYVYNIQTKQYEFVPYPNKNFQSKRWGIRTTRQYLYSFNQAGFDVLMVDKRGHGISGGVNAYDSAEMAEDIFRMLDQLESGDGLSLLTSTGHLLRGKETAGLLLRGLSAKKVPVIVGGESQGSMVTCFAMQKNCVGWTAYNEPGQKFSPDKKYNIKGAILLADFAGGFGYVDNPDFMGSWGVYREAAFRVEKNTMKQPSSEILANIDKWPAVFFGKGLWDHYQSAEGTYEAYHRAKGLKELVFLRGPHDPAWAGIKNATYMTDKMIEFAVRAVVNPGKKYPEFKSLKEAVISSPPYWEPSSRH
jgi:pimeloyl-ACP methyl ester carboxylesterase